MIWSAQSWERTIHQNMHFELMSFQFLFQCDIRMGNGVILVMSSVSETATVGVWTFSQSSRGRFEWAWADCSLRYLFVDDYRETPCNPLPLEPIPLGIHLQRSDVFPLTTVVQSVHSGELVPVWLSSLISLKTCPPAAHWMRFCSHTIFCVNPEIV